MAQKVVMINSNMNVMEVDTKAKKVKKITSLKQAVKDKKRKGGIEIEDIDVNTVSNDPNQTMNAPTQDKLAEIEAQAEAEDRVDAEDEMEDMVYQQQNDYEEVLDDEGEELVGNESIVYIKCPASNCSELVPVKITNNEIKAGNKGNCNECEKIVAVFVEQIN